MKYYLSIDCGGTTTKTALYTEDGREVGVESVETELFVPYPDFTERSMESMKEAVFTAIRNLLNKTGVPSEQVACVACCGHGKGLYLWGYDGKPVRPGILSADNRAYEYTERWKKDGTEEKVFGISLQHIMACQPVALLAWLKDHEPDAIGKTQWIFECKDYVRFCLTGEARGELTDYSGANFVNLTTRQYDRELLKCFGLEEIYDKLPPLCASTEICGYINAEAAEKSGLAEGTPVAGGMFDIDACALAVNAAYEDRLCAIAGTWSINEYIRKEPVTDGSVAMNSLFCDSDYYLIEESSATSAGNNEWFIRTLLPELREQAAAEGKSVYDLCNEMVASIPTGEFSPIFTPFLFASNVHPNAKGSLIGLTGYHTRAHVVRGVYEGITFCHKYHIDKLLASRDEPPRCIQLAGGVAKSDVWSQMFADVMGLPVETIDVNETGALGCAITSAVAVGAYPTLRDAAEHMVKVKARFVPDSAATADYAGRYRIYKKVLDALDPIWDDVQEQLIKGGNTND